MENRTDHPNVELCIDEIYYGLVNEIKQLEASVNALQVRASSCAIVIVVVIDRGRWRDRD